MFVWQKNTKAKITANPKVKARISQVLNTLHLNRKKKELVQNVDGAFRKISLVLNYLRYAQRFPIRNFMNLFIFKYMLLRPIFSKTFKYRYEVIYILTACDLIGSQRSKMLTKDTIYGKDLGNHNFLHCINFLSQKARN